MGGTEQKYINEAFAQNWIAPLGPNVDAFEKELGTAVKAKQVAALASGTSAIHLALILLDVRPGDYVIGSSFTFSATINPIAYQGATPVLIDSEEETWNMDPFLLEKAIKGEMDHPPGVTDTGTPPRLGGEKPFSSKSINTLPKAIIIAHLYGMPAKMNEIMTVANKYNIPVIEDAAEALGSEYMGKRVGTTGKFGILSFNGNQT